MSDNPVRRPLDVMRQWAQKQARLEREAERWREEEQQELRLDPDGPELRPMGLPAAERTRRYGEAARKQGRDRQLIQALRFS